MKILLGILFSSLILSSCIFFSRVIVRYPVNYANNKKLDSLTIKKRDFVINFMSLCLDKNQNEVSYFVADSIDIIWDYPNDSPKNIQYKDVFLSKGLDIFFHPELKDPKEILNFSDGYFLPDSSGTRKLYENGFNVRFGPSRCFDKCAWYNFSFRRKGDSYELVGVFLDG